MTTKGQILVALDTTDIDVAVTQARAVGGTAAGVKIGLEFFLANGPLGYRRVSAGGLPIFLDLKLHDIPNTVAGAVRAVTPLGPAILNVHAAGGRAMMQAARDAAAETADKRRIRRPKLIAVTVLTSLDDADLTAVGQATPTADQVRRLARLAKESGLDGVVCSPHEIEVLRRDLGEDFLLVTPGIRPSWAQVEGAQAKDQKRVMTPAEAAAAGADYLVIGRPITGHADPAKAARMTAAEIDAG